MSLGQELDDLYRMKESRKRGRLFEQFVAHLLEEQGFDVTVNPRTAKPRQTDLCAKDDGLFFIIEAKWQKTPVHVGSVAATQERLRRTPPDVFGCMFSMSGYTAPAKAYAADNRSPEVLLFAENEIVGLTLGVLEFPDLLLKKRDEIRTHARVWFSDWTPTGWERSRFPSLGPEVFRIDGQSLGWLLTGTQGDDVIFAREMLDLGSYSESACSLRLRVGIRTVDDLSKLLGHLRAHLRLEGADSFAIHQRAAGWYGSGADNFVLAAKQWEQRYKQLNWPSYHHSETLAYFDRLSGGGLMSLTLQQRVGKNAFFHAGFVEILTSGVPVDTAAVQRLCAKTGNSNARYEIVTDRPIQTHRFHPFVEVKPIGLAVDPREGGWASGLIARNPFYERGARGSFGGSELANSPIRFLSNAELIFCRLRSWHGAARPMDRYELEHVEGCWIENIPVLYIACDWR